MKQEQAETNIRTCESEKEPIRKSGSKIYKPLILLKKLIDKLKSRLDPIKSRILKLEDIIEELI